MPDSQLKPITFSNGLKSISDDDLCANCTKCEYNPGEMSGCKANWPGLEDADGYVQQCGSLTPKAVAAKAFLNPAQMNCLEFYSQGDFEHMGHIADEASFKESLQACGDGLLVFLLTELATSEDCNGIQESLSRVASAIEDLQAVERNLNDLPEMPDWS